jgi:hypothetical protein
MTERRRVRVILEFEVEIRDMKMAAIKARNEERLRKWSKVGYVPETPMETPSAAELEDLKLLQQALLAAPTSLAEWVKHEVTTHLDSLGIEVPIPVGRAENRILLPVVETLPPAQRRKFREAIADDEMHDTFLELAGEFYESFDTSVRSVELSVMELPEA